MKIGILTQPLGHNYGGLLQNYALQTVLKNLGHEPITIDQSEVKTPAWVRYKADLKTFLLKAFGIPTIRNFNYYPSKKEISIFRKYTDSFIKRYINRTSRVKSFHGIKKIIERNKFDAYIVGSDQCWRPRYNRFIKFMYLSFLPFHSHVLRIAYAASFGTDAWEYNERLTKECKTLISKFDAVSVRESHAVKLCKDFLGVNAEQVLDPTMLLGIDDYYNLIGIKDPIKVKERLFYYILDPDPKKIGLVEMVSKRHNLESFKVVPKFQEETRSKYDIKHSINDCIYPPVSSWLKGIATCRIAIVDSFHGAVFCILFNKPFWVVGNKVRGNSRFYSLLSMFDLEDRLIDIDKIDVLTFNFINEIDWVKVNRILHKQRNFSMNFLKRALKINKDSYGYDC